MEGKKKSVLGRWKGGVRGLNPGDKRDKKKKNHTGKTQVRNPTRRRRGNKGKHLEEEEDVVRWERE